MTNHKECVFFIAHDDGETICTTCCLLLLCDELEESKAECFDGVTRHVLLLCEKCSEKCG